MLLPNFQFHLFLGSNEQQLHTQFLLTLVLDMGVWGGGMLAVILAIAIIGPFLTADPVALNPMSRLKAPGEVGFF
ncbi:MAG: hypothetical protein F6K17_38685, partial [Okeania sp. SIO3C4]|nr:hypothetical protein [Okeania sp. SIO3C4]